LASLITRCKDVSLLLPIVNLIKVTQIAPAETMHVLEVPSIFYPMHPDLLHLSSLISCTFAVPPK